MKQLDNYFKASEELKKVFCKKYFKEIPTDCYWVAERIAEVLVVNDYFFNMSDIVDSLRFNISGKKLFKWYDYQLTEGLAGRVTMNLVSWVKLKK